MSLRTQITISVACAVGLAVGVTSIAAFVAFDHSLRQQVDESLRARAAQVIDEYRAAFPGEHDIPESTDASAGHLQIVAVVPTGRGSHGAEPNPRQAPGEERKASSPPPGESGTRSPSTPEDAGKDKIVLPAAVTDVAKGSPQEAFFDQTIDGVPFRLYARHLSPGVALIVGRAVTDIATALAEIQVLAIAVGAGGVALAVLLGWLVGYLAVRPVSRVTEAIETASVTRDLAHRVDVRRGDELGRLATSVNNLLGALDESQRARQQLVADASHELRSPLASLRTNVEVLTSSADLPEPDRRALVRDVRAQTQELTVLIDDLMALARGRAATAAREQVALDELVANAIDRTWPRARAKGVAIDRRLQPCAVAGVAADLERAVMNLLDNAVKWSPAGGTVEVTLTSGGALTVRDHGPGISAEHRPHVFDRFYRAPNARSLPGSGLGLAIVGKVADEHDGTVSAEAAPGGGAQLRLTLPAVSDHE